MFAGIPRESHMSCAAITSVTSLFSLHLEFVLLYILLFLNHAAGCLLLCKPPQRKWRKLLTHTANTPQGYPHVIFLKEVARIWFFFFKKNTSKVQFDTENKLTLRAHPFLSSVRTLYHCTCSGTWQVFQSAHCKTTSKEQTSVTNQNNF